jgi:hypothetical protein
MKLSEQLDRIEVAVDSIRTTIGLENAVIEDVATGTSNKINELNTTITSQSETIVAKDGEITTLTEAVATKENEITALNETVDEKDAEIGALNSAIEGKDNTITTLQNQISDLEEQLPEGNITITENGTHNVAAYETAIINVMTVVEGGGPTTGTPSLNLGEKYITENGTYNSTDDGLDGYSTVVVNIEQIAGATEAPHIHHISSYLELNDLIVEDGDVAVEYTLQEVEDGGMVHTVIIPEKINLGMTIAEYYNGLDNYFLLERGTGWSNNLVLNNTKSSASAIVVTYKTATMSAIETITYRVDPNDETGHTIISDKGRVQVNFTAPVGHPTNATATYSEKHAPFFKLYNYVQGDTYLYTGGYWRSL